MTTQCIGRPLGDSDAACYAQLVPRRTLLERIVDERVGQPLVGTISVAVDRLAEEIAREALADPDFRRTIRELVSVRSRAILARLLRDGESAGRSRTRPKSRPAG